MEFLKSTQIWRYPEIRRVGFQFSTFVANGIGRFNFSDLNIHLEVAARINYPIYANLYRSICCNRCKSKCYFDDADGDEVPDFIDPFPDQDNYWFDT